MEDPSEDVVHTAQLLMETVQQEVQEVKQLHAENAALRQALASRTTNFPTVSATTPHFSLDPNKLKEFLDSLTVFFALRPSQFTQDKTKVGYLISALSGPALAWTTPRVAADDPRLSNCIAFVVAFKQMFEHPGLESSAEEALCEHPAREPGHSVIQNMV
ncbi:protein LDOC1-like [Pleurodeles waltl]|uniref:protein LDOC1-like n=1 Tax=Pleurodeles waltl TaxID=8319 RepID=UPI003709588D